MKNVQQAVVILAFSLPFHRWRSVCFVLASALQSSKTRLFKPL